MAKSKEIYKKGMSKEDIYKKLEGFKTDSGKIGYLNQISEKEGLLDSKTKKSVYETLGDLNLRREDFEASADYYGKIGDKKKVKEALIKGAVKAAKNFGYSNAAEFYEKAGEKEEAKENWIKAGDSLAESDDRFMNLIMEYYSKGGLKDEKKIFNRIGGLKFKKGSFYRAAQYYDKSGEEKKSREAYLKSADEDVGRTGVFSSPAVWASNEESREGIISTYQKSGLNRNQALERIGDLLAKSSPTWAEKWYEEAGLDFQKNSDKLNRLSEGYEKNFDGVKAMDTQKKIKKLSKK